MRKSSSYSTEKARSQLLRYLFVGGIATTVDVAMFALFSQVFLIDYRIAIVLGFSFGVLTNFSLCNWLVFPGKRSPLWLVFLRHYLASISGLLSNEIMMISLVEVFHFKNLVLAKIMSSAVAFVLNFTTKKLYVYNNSFYKDSKKNKSTPSLIGRRSQQ